MFFTLFMIYLILYFYNLDKDQVLSRIVEKQIEHHY